MNHDTLDPMIEQYKAQLLAFSRRHPKFSSVPQTPPAETADVPAQTQTQAESEPVTVEVQRLVPPEELLRADFDAGAGEAVTVEMRLQNVAQREQMPQTETPPAEETVARAESHVDTGERAYAQCDHTDPPYCNGTIDTFTTREDFMEMNPAYGYLRVQVSVAQQAYPVQNAHVEISKTFSGKKNVFFESQTDASGIVSRVTLPAPDRDLSSAPSALQPYSTYDILVSHPNFTDVYVPNCIVFATIETIQQVRMVPLESCAENAAQSFCEEG